MATSPKSKKFIVWWQLQLARYFTWWAVAVVVLVVGGGSWLWLRPLYRDVRENNQAVELAAQLSRTHARFEALQAKAQAWAQNNEGDAINLILPSYSDLPNLLTELDALATHSRLQLQGLSVTQEGSGSSRSTTTASTLTDSGIHQLKVNLSLTGGTYSRLRDFLRQTTSAWRLVALKSLTFGRDGNYAVELTSYFYTH